MGCSGGSSNFTSTSQGARNGGWGWGQPLLALVPPPRAKIYSGDGEAQRPLSSLPARSPNTEHTHSVNETSLEAGGLYSLVPLKSYPGQIHRPECPYSQVGEPREGRTSLPSCCPHSSRGAPTPTCRRIGCMEHPESQKQAPLIPSGSLPICSPGHSQSDLFKMQI